MAVLGNLRSKGRVDVLSQGLQGVLQLGEGHLDTRSSVGTHEDGGKERGWRTRHASLGYLKIQVDVSIKLVHVIDVRDKKSLYPSPSCEALHANRYQNPVAIKTMKNKALHKKNIVAIGKTRVFMVCGALVINKWDPSCQVRYVRTLATRCREKP